MADKTLPRYPVYIPSKGRVDTCLTPRALLRSGCPFYLVVEPQEESIYREKFGEQELCTILVLPKNDGRLIYARNWIKAHATELGFKRHWQLDDNIRRFRRYYRKHRLPCEAGVALRVCEDFTDRYSNVAISGLNYTMFAFGGTAIPPFYRNQRVYSCSLILNASPFEWRLIYNDDTDICLQALAAGWCTLLVNAFLADKAATMTIRGGNTDDLYKFNDGRLKMSRTLERLWPGVVETKRRFKRPQHVVKDSWRRFDNPLILTEEPIEQIEYGLKLKVLKEIQSAQIKELLEE